MMQSLEQIQMDKSVNGTKTIQIMLLVVLMTLILLSVHKFVVKLAEILNVTMM